MDTPGRVRYTERRAGSRAHNRTFSAVLELRPPRAPKDLLHIQHAWQWSKGADTVPTDPSDETEAR